MENDNIKAIEEHRDDPLEQRIFRLETVVIEMSKTQGEMMDRVKNAHHRIDETNDSINKLREEMKENFVKFKEDIKKEFTKFKDMFVNLGKNLETNLESSLDDKEKSDKKWHKIIILVACLAVGAFVGVYIQDSEIKKGIGEIAVKVGVGAASAL